MFVLLWFGEKEHSKMPNLLFNYNNWQFWENYAPPLYFGQQKVTFWGEEKLILVNEGVTELNFEVDVYSAWKEWVQDPNQTNAKWPEAISGVGGDPLPGDRTLGTTFFLENGWRMRPWEGDHTITVTGNIFTREGSPIFVSPVDKWAITINLNTSTLVETAAIALGPAAIDQIVNSVWSEELSGTAASSRLINVPQDVWQYIIDTSRNQSAGDKLKKIATKTQDIAFS